jgi:hypothetical protein
VRRTTTQCSIEGQSGSTLSIDSFIGSGLPRRSEKSAVTSTFASQSLMRSLTASAANPPNTTECGAPIRAHASMAAGASGIIGR